MGALVSQSTLQPTMVLGEGTCPKLPEDAYDLLDVIQEAAKNVFGGMQLSRTQELMMEEAGFPLLHGAGLIRTPKGSVRYTPQGIHS
jgi:hypothetical protein